MIFIIHTDMYTVLVGHHGNPHPQAHPSVTLEVDCNVHSDSYVGVSHWLSELISPLKGSGKEDLGRQWWTSSANHILPLPRMLLA